MEELPLTFRFIALFLLLGVNAFFAAAEVALVSVRETRMRALAEGGDRRAQTVLDLIGDPDRMLSATQLGVTLASLGLGWAGESTMYRLIEPLFTAWITPQNENLFHAGAFVLAFSAITFLHMVVGEVVPKNFALERAERLSRMVGPPLELFSRATGFFVSLVEGTAASLSRMIGLKVVSPHPGYTSEELKVLLEVSRREGGPAQAQERMLHRVVDFYDVTVREVMTPRKEMIALPAEATLDQTLDVVTRYQHSRIPVYEGSPEHVAGVLHVKQVWAYVAQMRRWQALDRPPPQFVLRSYVRAVAFVPETKMIHELLEEFQSRRSHIAMVVDEFGTVAGLVTLEDVLEQIVGEIREEHERPAPAELGLGGPVIEMDGITNIRDLETLFQIELPYDAGFETLAGFLLSRLGFIPQGGEQVVYGGRRYTIVEMHENRIAKVRIEPVAGGEAAAEAAPRTPSSRSA